jgi:hypothetical protein
MSQLYLYHYQDLYCYSSVSKVANFIKIRGEISKLKYADNRTDRMNSFRAIWAQIFNDMGGSWSVGLLTIETSTSNISVGYCCQLKHKGISKRMLCESVVGFVLVVLNKLN